MGEGVVCMSSLLGGQWHGRRTDCVVNWLNIFPSLIDLLAGHVLLISNKIIPSSSLFYSDTPPPHHHEDRRRL